jgi:hypothetical protein
MVMWRWFAANMPGILGKNVKRSKAALANTPLPYVSRGLQFN